MGQNQEGKGDSMIGKLKGKIEAKDEQGNEFNLDSDEIYIKDFTPPLPSPSGYFIEVRFICRLKSDLTLEKQQTLTVTKIRTEMRKDLENGRIPTEIWMNGETYDQLNKDLSHLMNYGTSVKLDVLEGLKIIRWDRIPTGEAWIV
jgi:hypothetical protein